VFSDGRRSEVSIGPVVQYSTTDSTPDRFVTASQPYGVGNFGQAGLQAHFSHDLRDQVRYPHRGMLAELTASVYPALWDVTSTFGKIAAGVTGYLTVPVPLHPILALRGGAQKVFGDYPFNEAAFVGGMTSVRTLVPQRYAGDASLAGTAELRIPLARFPLVLPLNVGLFGFVDTGRVYVNGDSPGGWHTAAGGGFWVGVLDPSTAISVALTTGAGQTGLLIRAGLTF
jgi:outer membrane protein assembly factor BamA